MEQTTMTLKEVAEFIRLNEKAVGRLAQNKELPAAKVGGQWRFQRADVEVWVKNNVQPVMPVLPPEATGVAATLTIVGAMTPNRINLNLLGADRDAVLREMTALVIPPTQRRLHETLFAALKAREELCSTCVDEGVAVPHARNALVGLVTEPVLAYGRHCRGIDFGALDGKPVRHYFLLCAPNVRQHLQLLARLARLIKEPSFREKLNGVGQPEQVVELIRDAELGLGI